jgi:putative addiction module component (TIGR02574 family)
MSTLDLLREALRLAPQDRFLLIDGLMKSLDVPDAQIDAVWAEEAEKRLAACREGRMEVIPMEDVLG